MTVACFCWHLLGVLTLLQAVDAAEWIVSADPVSSSLSLRTSAQFVPCNTAYSVLKAQLETSCEDQCWLLHNLVPALSYSRQDNVNPQLSFTDQASLQRSENRLMPHNLITYNQTALNLRAEEVLLRLHCNQSSSCTAEPNSWRVGSLLHQYPHTQGTDTSTDPAKWQRNDCVTMLSTVVTGKSMTASEDQLHSSSTPRSTLVAWLIRIGVIFSLSAVYKLL